MHGKEKKRNYELNLYLNFLKGRKIDVIFCEKEKE